MNTVVVWILVAVSLSTAGDREASPKALMPSFGPPVASAEDCQKLLEAVNRIMLQIPASRSSMTCVPVHVPTSSLSAGSATAART